jgi:hypothetical protein
MTARILQSPPFVVRLAEEDEAWLVICREHGWLYGSRVEASADAMLIARGGGGITAHMIKISHSMTSDSPDGQPWPPPDRNALWVIVRRAEGFTLWRAIQLAEVRSAETFAIPR